MNALAIIALAALAVFAMAVLIDAAIRCRNAYFEIIERIAK